MAEPSIHINYSFDDIQRYLQGKMSAAEMHNIEKMALQDPFLADAIEGYSQVPALIADKHLKEINSALHIEKKDLKVVAFKRKTQWLNIAALIIILAGIGVVVSYFFKSSNQKQQVAQVKEEAVHNFPKDTMPSSMIAPLDKQDTTLLMAQIKNLKKLKPLEKRSIENSISAVKDSEQFETSISDISAPITLPNEAASKPLNQEITSNSKPDSNMNILPGSFSGKVIDENGNPVAGVTIQSADKKAATVTNLNGDFSLNKNDSTMNVTASTVGYDSATKNLRSGNNNRIILRGISSGMNEEVITTALISAKKSKISKDSASPVGGWQNFNNYVLNKLNKDSTNKNFMMMNDDDVVEIEFLIDNAGNPYDIKITKPLDDQHNAKAIDIIKSGPKWTRTSKNKKAKVAINF